MNTSAMRFLNLFQKNDWTLLSKKILSINITHSGLMSNWLWLKTRPQSNSYFKVYWIGDKPNKFILTTLMLWSNLEIYLKLSGSWTKLLRLMVLKEKSPNNSKNSFHFMEIYQKSSNSEKISNLQTILIIKISKKPKK